jgi:hypothetical protein
MTDEDELDLRVFGIELPDYEKMDGSKPSQPFSKTKHDLKKPTELKSLSEKGGRERIDYFIRHLVRIRNAIGRPVPYRFIDSHGRKRSMDAGCLKFVGPGGLDIAEFVLRKGYIVALELKQSLLGRSAEPSNLENDFEAVRNDTNISETTRQQLIEARIGQGQFRIDVLAQWDERCAMTGCDLKSVVRASHIVPWREASNDERLDPENGLPLVATLDALFDAGLISFNDDGTVLFKESLSDRHRMLVPAPRRLTRRPGSKARRYFARHRAAHGFAS